MRLVARCPAAAAAFQMHISAASATIIPMARGVCNRKWPADVCKTAASRLPDRPGAAALCAWVTVCALVPGTAFAQVGGKAPLQPGQQELPLSDFDHGNVRASCVVSVPDGYDAAKPWPLILDFHGAISPSRKGANLVAARVWSGFVKKAPFLVVGPNGRTRAWGMVSGDRNDKALAMRVLVEVREKFTIDPKRVYLAGFSSGADFLCSGGLQQGGRFAGSLVICPGPPNVLGIRNGKLMEAKTWPFYFATGEEDYIRKKGAWEAFVALEKAGGNVMYREVPGKGHEFFGIDEYARLFGYLEIMAGSRGKPNHLAIARSAIVRGDFLLATSHLSKLKTEKAAELLAEVRKQAKALLKQAEAIDVKKGPGQAYEAWWRLQTQFHRLKPIADQAQRRIDTLEAKHPARDLYRARRDWFRHRQRTAAQDGR